MTQPLGVDDFFTLEAGEYLQRLASMVGSEAGPNPEELVRFTRALRGSALMANQHPIARAAGGLEKVVRAHRDGRRGWDRDLATLCIEAVGTLRALVERVRQWNPDDTARADRLAAQLESSAGEGPRTSPAPQTGSEAGVRAFLAREAASVGSALDQAARALRATPSSIDSPQAVLRRMQPLRGLAALADYPPLAELLDGIEGSIAALARLDLAAPDIAQRFEAAAQALARAARDVAESGRPDPEAAEFRAFADLLRSANRPEPAVVPIEQLFFPGDSGIVYRGTPPRGALSQTLTPLSIVSRAEHLSQVADEIAHAGSATQRELRLHTLMDDLRVLSSGLLPALERAVERFATAARDAIAGGSAAREAARFADLLSGAGARLRSASDVVDQGSVARHFEELAVAVEALATPVASATARIDTDQLPIVPIESLELVEAVEGSGGTDLAASWARFEELAAGAARVVEAAAAAAGTGAPMQVATPEAPGRPLTEAAAPRDVEPPVVAIETLLYRGHTAVERAQEVGRELRRALTGAPTPETLQPLVDELLDLVALAGGD